MTETATISVPDFVAVLRRSGLVDDGKLRTALAGVDLQHVQAEDIAHLLTEAKLLTEWQARQVLKGRHKGYRLGKYLLLGELGRGGMAKVFLGRHETLLNLVAIKVLSRQRLAKPSMIHRFLREARAAAQLNHPNIVRVYDVDADEDRNYLVMEYVRGRSVQDMVDDDGPLALDKAVRFTREAALGLAAAHKHGLIHRDVKPANLLVEDDRLVKLSDFGLARAGNEEEDDAPSLTMQHEEKVLGTADYIAPEQAINSHAIDARADLYSLGYTLYFMLTGQPPFPTGRIVERLTKHCTLEPEGVRHFRPDAPESLLAIIHKLTRKNAAERYASAEAAAAALGDWLARSAIATNAASPASWSRSNVAARPSSQTLTSSTIDDELSLAPDEEENVDSATAPVEPSIAAKQHEAKAGKREAKRGRQVAHAEELPELDAAALLDDDHAIGGVSDLLDDLPTLSPLAPGRTSDVHGSDVRTRSLEQARIDTSTSGALPSRIDRKQRSEACGAGRILRGAAARRIPAVAAARGGADFDRHRRRGGDELCRSQQKRRR